MFSTTRMFKYTGWVIGFAAFVLYMITMSQGVNFWDSAEFIVSAGKLQVGHPPGAPFYVLVARVFSIFSFGNEQLIAFLVNLMSVLSASVTVVFAYYSLVLLLKRIFRNESLTVKNIDIVILCGSIIGSLSIAVSLSFWSAATEAEVYSFSSMLTAIIFWSVLKLDVENNKQMCTRWLILISLLLGLSLGTHLLGLLVLPALVMVVYFKYYSLHWKTAIIATTIAVLSPIVILNIYMPVMLHLAKWADIFAVNSLSLPVNTGLIVFVFLVFGLLAWGIFETLKKNQKILHIALLSITMLSLGFSSYALIVIRSSANPPIDESNPENIVNLISYIQREQYGNQALFYGPMFNSGLDKRNPYEEGKKIRKLTNEGYEIVSYTIDANYLKRDMRWLPRMWSKQPEHAVGYLTWSKASHEKVPDFKSNMLYFIRYQTGHMYVRYFMWNFVGKQNDLQAHGSPLRGNWLSGIGFIDNSRLGVKADKSNPFNNIGTNKYFFFPLILGIIGLVVQFRRDIKGFWVLMALFLFTGFAIVIYLNQYPFQPRERDYSFLGSFYTYGIWIGIGASGLLYMVLKYLKKPVFVGVFSLLLIFIVPGIMFAENFKDCDKSNQALAKEMAYNILNTCKPNAILFTNGDNDTFPLWYLQEIEGFRTDVRVVNMSYLNMDWYIDQCKRKQYQADPVPISITGDLYQANIREYNLVQPNFLPFVDTIYSIYKNEINRDFDLLVEKLMFTLNNSDFEELNPEAYKQVVNEFQNIRPHVGNQRFLEFRGFVLEIVKPENISGYNLRVDAASDLAENMSLFVQKQGSYPLPIGSVLDFVFSDDEKNMINTLLSTKKMNYVPGQIFMLPIDKQQLVITNTVSPENIEYIVPKMQWKVDKKVFTKSDLIILDIIRTNNWERPIYFVSTAGNQNFLGLEKYFSLEGFAYRLIPQITPLTSSDYGTTNPYIISENIFNVYNYNSISDSSVYLDENMRSICMNMRNMFSRAARDLYFVGEIEKSKEVIDKCLEYIPNDKVAYNFYSVSLVHAYYRINQKRKARELAIVIADNMESQLLLMLEMDNKYQLSLDEEEKRILAIMQELKRYATEYKHKEFESEISLQFNSMYEAYARKKGLYEE